MSRWFRFYDESLDDPKVQLLKPEIFKAWVNILCLASKNGGVLPPEAELSFALRLSEEKACEILNELMVRGLLDMEGDAVRPHNWDRRQYKSDISNDRVKRFRAKDRNDDVTLHETPPETETDSETDNTSVGGILSREPRAAAASIDLIELEKRCEEATGLCLAGRKIEVIAKLISEGVALEDRILPVMRTAAAELREWGKPPPKTWAYFEKPIRDETRKAAPAARKIETVFVIEGSPQWQALCTRKPESYLRSMLNGKRGIPWPAADLANVSRETIGVRE